MARATLADRLDHILGAVARVEALTADKSFEDYSADWVARDAVERNLERVCEATRYIPNDLKARHAAIPWQLADLGNVLRHAYDAVVDERISDIVNHHLRPLKAAVETMLRDAESGPPDHT